MFDLQSVVNNHMAAARAEQMKTSRQFTLGELILKLEAVSPTFTDHKGEEKDKRVVFNFEYLHPTGLLSWRGLYRELAISFEPQRHGGDDTWSDEAPSVREFIAALKRAIGRTYEGYKGGDFVMGKTTPVWVANYGNAGNTGVVDITDSTYEVRLETAYCEC